MAVGRRSQIPSNKAVEKNGFTHKDAVVTARGKLTGTVAAPISEVVGTQDRFALVPALPPPTSHRCSAKPSSSRARSRRAPKGKVADTLRYNTITEAQ